MRTFIKIISGIIIALVVLACGLVAFIHYEISDAKLAENVQRFLSYEFGTEVKVKGAKLHPFESEVAIYGLSIKDKKKVDMLKIDTLEALVNFEKLWHKEVVVYGFKLAGANAILYKEKTDSEANYQFIVDAVAFSGDKSATKKEKDKRLTLDLRKVEISRTNVKWDIHSKTIRNNKYHHELDLNHLWVHNLSMAMSLQAGGTPGDFVGKIDHLTVDEHNSLMAIMFKGVNFDGIRRDLNIGDVDFSYDDNHVCMKELRAKGISKGKVNIHHVTAKNIYFENGIGIPKKWHWYYLGDFDPTHLQLNMSLDATASILDADSIDMKIDRLSLKDKTSGLNINNISMNLSENHHHAIMRDVNIRVGSNTSLNIDKAVINMPQDDGVKHTPLTYSASAIKGSIRLKDIASAFGPDLSHFTTQLYTTLTLTGNEEKANLQNIHIRNMDGRVQAHGSGAIYMPKKAGDEGTISLNVKSLTAKNGMGATILSEFPEGIKPDIVNLAKQIGDLSFHGSLYIPFRCPYIKGVLGTKYGDFYADLKLNMYNYYATGTLSTKAFHLGDFIGNTNIGDVSVKANMKMDIAAPKVAQIIHRRQGQFPIAHLSGRAMEASYMGIKIRDIDYDIQSNANGAKGKLWAVNKLAEISCDFAITDPTNIKKGLKVKPHIKIHSLKQIFSTSDEQLAKRAAKKEAREKKRKQRKAEKAAKKAAKEKASAGL